MKLLSNEVRKMKAASLFLLVVSVIGLSLAYVPATADASVAAMPGQNIVCSTSGTTQLCASVSNKSPTQYSYVTVYGRLLVSGMGQSGKAMKAVWHYKTTTPSCSATTNTSGLASCKRYISRATKGYKVNIVVTINGKSVTTSFTPH